LPLFRVAIDGLYLSRHEQAMTKPAETPTRASAKSAESPKHSREDQLAQALRDNLRRRKAQAQARGAKNGAPGPDRTKD
jgi:hypothetical protein